MIRRREFIAGLGSAAAWPLVARAQQPDRMRRIGVLMAGDENDPEGKTHLSGFMQGLAELGWTEGRNLRMDIRWASGNVDLMRKFAKEVVGLQPDVILATSTPTTAALQRETRTTPIVFAGLPDPVGEGFVASLPRPGGNATGFIAARSGIDAEPAGFDGSMRRKFSRVAIRRQGIVRAVPARRTRRARRGRRLPLRQS